MPITLTTASGKTIPLGTLTDLENNLATGLQLGAEYEAFLAGPIRAVPDGFATSIQYASGNQQWNVGPAAAPVSFTLGGGVTGKLSVVKSGAVFQYTNSFPTVVTSGLTSTDNSKQDSQSVPAAPSGNIYLCVELDFTIQAGVNISYQQGIYGLTGSASSSDTFQVAFYKECQAADNFQQSIARAFGDLVLPFHPETLNHLKIGDYLRHTASSNLQLGMGASVGYKLFNYAGQWSSGIQNVANSPALTAGVNPKAQAAVTFAYNFGYSGSFDQILWKDTDKIAHLHLYRSKSQTQGVDLNASISVSLNASLSTAAVQSQVANSAKNAAPAGDLQDALTQVFAQFPSQVAAVSSDINSKASAILKPFNNTQQITLDAKISQTQQNFLLLNFTIYLSNTAWSQAWSSMCNGRYQEAVEQSGGSVELDPGSGLESLYSQTSALSLNFFGQWTANWSKNVISNSSLIYAGNNTFHLISADGMQWIKQINKASTEVDVYFSVDASLSGTAAAANPNFNITLRAVNNPAFGNYIAGFVGLLTAGQNGGAAAQNRIAAMAAKGNTTEMLQLVFKSSQCAALQYSGTPACPGSDQADRNNYGAFARGCRAIMPGPWGQLIDDRGNNLGYGDWSNWNKALTTQAGMPLPNCPDRTATGPLDGAEVAQFVGINWPGISATQVGYPLQAASEFMNLCQDLQQVSTQQITAAQKSWQQFVQHLIAVVNRDVSQDFVAPTALALSYLLANGSPQWTVGPAPGLEGDASIAFTMIFA